MGVGGRWGHGELRPECIDINRKKQQHQTYLRRKMAQFSIPSAHVGAGCVLMFKWKFVCVCVCVCVRVCACACVSKVHTRVDSESKELDSSGGV